MAANKRVYFHYEELEEYKQGMWKIIRGAKRKEYIGKASDLMRRPAEFKTAMQSALKSWTNSMLFNLTAIGVNKIAFLGHAGCCVSTGSPEECTRVAWHTLTKSEQDEANRVAGEVLEEWIARYNPKIVNDLFSGL